MIWLERIFRRSNSPVNIVKAQENNPGSPKDKKSCNSPTNLHNTSGCQNQNITTGDNIPTSSGHSSSNTLVEKVESSMKFEPVEFKPLGEKEKLHKDEILSRTSHPVSILRKPQVMKMTSKNVVTSPANPNGQLPSSSTLVSSSNYPSVSYLKTNQDEPSSKTSLSNNASNNVNDRLTTSRVLQHVNHDDDNGIHQNLSPSICRKRSHGSSSLSLDGDLQQSFYFFQNSIGSGKNPLSLTNSSSFGGCQICQSKNYNCGATSESINRLKGVNSTHIGGSSSSKGIAVKNIENNGKTTIGNSPSLQCRQRRSFTNICRNHRSSPIILPTVTSTAVASSSSSNAIKVVNRKNSNNRNFQILEKRNDNTSQYGNIINAAAMMVVAGSTQLNSSKGDQDRAQAQVTSGAQKQKRKHEKNYEITTSACNITMETSENPLQIPVASPTNILPHHNSSSHSQNDDGSVKDILIGDVFSLTDENIDDPQSVTSFSFNENHINDSFSNSFEDIIEDGFTKTVEDHPFIMKYFNENKNK